MLHSRAVSAALALVLAGCGSSGGQIRGTVTVAKGLSGLDVFVALWSVPAATLDGDGGLVADGTPTFVTSFDLGTVDGSGGTYAYDFHSLSEGLYLVGAYLDTPFDASPDVSADVHDLNQDNFIQINPAVKGEATAVQNLYLGMSAPNLGTISGTLNIGSAVSMDPVSLLVWTSNPYTSTPNLIDQQEVTPGTSTVTYQLFNMPPTPVYVMAWAELDPDEDAEGTIDFNSDAFAFALQDPVTVDQSTLTATDVDMWLDMQGPDLGSVSGAIALTAPLASAQVTVLAFSSDYTQNASANVIAVDNVTGTNTASIPFTLTSLPIGTVYLLALTQTAALSVSGQTDVAQTPYTAGTNENLAPVAMTTAAPSVTGLSFQVGVGRVSGTVQLASIPSTLEDGWVAAVQTAGGTTYIRQLTQFSINPGTSSVPYEVFGLIDGTYDMAFVPDEANTGDITDNIMYQVTGTPSAVTITDGSPATCNFSFTYQ